MFSAIKRILNRQDRQREKAIYIPASVFRPYVPDANIWVSPDAQTQQWPTEYHSTCDIEFCGFANKPRTAAGIYQCGQSGCPGNFRVSAEMAAATVMFLEKRALRKSVKKTMRDMPEDARTILCGTAEDTRSRRPAYRARAASVATVATAPTMFFFPSAAAAHDEPQHPVAYSVPPRPSGRTSSSVRPLHLSHAAAEFRPAPPPPARSQAYRTYSHAGQTACAQSMRA